MSIQLLPQNTNFSQRREQFKPLPLNLYNNGFDNMNKHNDEDDEDENDTITALRNHCLRVKNQFQLPSPSPSPEGITSFKASGFNNGQTYGNTAGSVAPCRTLNKVHENILLMPTPSISHRSKPQLKTRKSLLKVKQGQLNYLVYSSNNNLQDATIYGTQINILQSMGNSKSIKKINKADCEKKEHSSSPPSSTIPLPKSEFETVSIKVNKSIKEEYKRRKRLEDRGGYYELSQSPPPLPSKSIKYLSSAGEAAAAASNCALPQIEENEDEFALIKAFTFNFNDLIPEQQRNLNNIDIRGQQKKHLTWSSSL